MAIAIQPTRPLPEGDFGRPVTGWRLRLFTVIFEADTRAGRAFDIALIVLIVLILASGAVAVLNSIESVHVRHSRPFDVLEWTFSAICTVEYIARLACVRRPLRYARSVFGVMDLLAILPACLTVPVPGRHALIDVRVLRLMRIFRIFKMGAYVAEFGALGHALAALRRKIFVFLGLVMMIVLVMGTLMYLVEGPANG